MVVVQLGVEGKSIYIYSILYSTPFEMAWMIDSRVGFKVVENRKNFDQIVDTSVQIEKIPKLFTITYSKTVRHINISVYFSL
jgi:hypothetical protein